MIDPIIGNTWGRKLCKKIVTFCQTWFVKQLIYPAFIIIPPALAVSIAQKAELKAEAVKLVGGPVGDAVNAFPTLLVIVLAPFYMILVKAIYAAIEVHSKPSKELSKDDLMSILKAIEIAVNEKAKRMSNNARRALSKGSVCPKETFSEITQPEQQMWLLVNGIHAIFEYLSNEKVSYRVGLLKIEDNKPTDWLAFHPHANAPATPAEVLGDPTSTVSYCIRTKKMAIVDDIEKELKKKKADSKRYFSSSDETKDKGSQLCFPVVHPATGKIHHVITIAGDQSCSLVDKHAPLYEWVLNHFVVRLSMEQSLLIMKEKANEHFVKTA